MENDHSSSPSENNTLLLVDDDKDVLDILEWILRDEGYHLLTAETAEHALNILAAQQVDVILCDQRLPDRLGTDLLSQIKVLYPNTIRMVQTGFADLKTVTTAINQGIVYKFLTKPWDEAQLKNHLAEAFQLKHQEDKNRALKAHIENTHAELVKKLDDYMQALSPVASTHSLYAEIIESIPIPMMALNADKNLVMANHAALEIFKDESPNTYSLHLLNHAMTADHADSTVEIPKGSGHLYQIKWKTLNIEDRCEGYILVLIRSL